MIGDELWACSEFLSKDDILTIPSNNWASIINSGGLSLFKGEELVGLNYIYQEISNYNYISIDNLYIPWDNISKKPEDQLLYARNQLQKDIKNLKEKEWMNPTQATITIKADEAGAYFGTKSKY